MTLKPNNVPWTVAIRSSVRPLLARPGLLGLARRFHMEGHAESVWDALMVVKFKNNRDLYGDDLAKAMGEIAKDEGRDSPFTMAPMFQKFDARRQAREERIKRQNQLRLLRREELERRLEEARVARSVIEARVARLTRECSRANMVRLESTAKHVGVTRAHRSPQSVTRINSPPGDDKPPPAAEPHSIRLIAERSA